MSSHKQLGQVFTDRWMTDYMVSWLAASGNDSILEPACGHGAFVNALLASGRTNITAYEIDATLPPDCPAGIIRHTSFIDVPARGSFKAIIGNPPYVRWKNLPETLKAALSRDPVWQTHCNALSDYLAYFIIKSVHMLQPGGELVFVTSDYWLGTLHSTPLRQFLADHGSIVRIAAFGELPVFPGISSSVMIFRYVKGAAPQPIDITDFRHLTRKNILAPDKLLQEGKHYALPAFTDSRHWPLSPETERDNAMRLQHACSREDGSYSTMGEICHIANGMVSGMDKAFQYNGQRNLHEQEASINVLKAKESRSFGFTHCTPYLYLPPGLQEKDVAERYPHFYAHLRPHKSLLNARYQYDRLINWWEWAFPRSVRLFAQPVEKIFVPGKERITHRDVLRFAIVAPGIYPTQDMTALVLREQADVHIHYVAALLNHPAWKNWFMHQGIRKGGVLEFSEKPLKLAPFLPVNKDHPEILRRYKSIIMDVGALRKAYDTDRHQRVNQHIDTLLALQLARAVS